MGYFRILLLLSTAALLSSAASAASPHNSVPVPAAPDFNWTGFYAGMSVGDARYDGGGIVPGGNIASILPPADIVHVLTTNSNMAGLTAGGVTGYNYQIGRMVLGGEADLSYLNVASQRSGKSSIACCGSFLEHFDFEYRSQVNWLGTVRARVGVTPAQRLLIYGTGGLAYGGVESSTFSSNTFTFSGNPAPVFGRGLPALLLRPAARFWQGSNSEIKLGWTVGAGGEYALTDHVVLRVEYMYVDLGKSSAVANFVGTPPTPEWGEIYYTGTRNTTLNIARAAVSYKF